MPKIELSYNDDHSIDVKETTERKLTDARFSYETAEGETVIVNVLDQMPFSFNPKEMEMLKGSTANLNLRLENIFMNYIGSICVDYTAASSSAISVGSSDFHTLPHKNGEGGICTAQALCEYYIPILGQDKIDLDNFTGVLRILGYLSFYLPYNPLNDELLRGARYTADNWIYHGTTTDETSEATLNDYSYYTPMASQDGIWNCLVRYENGVFTGYAISGMKDNKVVPLTQEYDTPIWLSGTWTRPDTGSIYYDCTILRWWNFGTSTVSSTHEYIYLTFLEED